ncbi:MAG: N-acetyltransferase [Candidatus Altiarchaeota archaeon]
MEQEERNTEGLEIRFSEQTDLGKVIDLLDERFCQKEGYDRDRIRKYVSLKHTQGRLFVAIKNFRVAALICFRPMFWEKAFYLEELAVKKEYQNSKIGTKCLNHLKDRAAQEHQRGVFLDTNPENEDAIRFYRENGFKEVGQIENLYKRGKKQLIYAWFND